MLGQQTDAMRALLLLGALLVSLESTVSVGDWEPRGLQWDGPCASYHSFGLPTMTFAAQEIGSPVWKEEASP